MPSKAKMKDDKYTLPQSSSLSLVSRLDHLDFLMKYLERRHQLAKLESSNNGGGSVNFGGELKKKQQCLPMDSALKDTYFKGTLMDRVAALENRLYQLCLEKESSSSSSTSTQASSCETFWSRGSSSCSLPTFTAHNKRLSPVHSTSFEIEEEPDIQTPKQKKPSNSPTQQKLRKKKTVKKDENGRKTEKKKPSTFSWPHLKLLGC